MRLHHFCYKYRNYCVTDATCSRYLTVWEVHQVCQTWHVGKYSLDTFFSKSNNYKLVRSGTCVGISEMLLHQVITIENNLVVMVTDNFNNFIWNDGQIAMEIKTCIFCSKFLPVANSNHTVVMV